MSSLIKLSDVGNLVDNRDAELLRERVADLLGRNVKSFPGAQPVSFSKKHFRDLQEQDYYLCEKTDGIRSLLFISFSIVEGVKEESCFLIDRKNDYYYIANEHLHFPLPNAPFESTHEDTLLDGELVLDIMPDGKEIKRYLVFDCLALDGKEQLTRPLNKRLAYFGAHVLEPYKNLLKTYPDEVPLQPFEVILKKMEKAYAAQMMFKDILPNLPHGNDGLVFTCVPSNYVTGTDQHILKWKPPIENTIDFRLQLGAFPTDEDGEEDWESCPSFDLLVNHGGGRHNTFAALYVSDEEWKSMKGMGQMLDGRIIECYKDAHGRWRYKKEPDGTPRFRDDKTEANFITTVDSVLESIEDAVSEQDLIDHAKAINVEWKKRERMTEEEDKKARAEAEAARRQHHAQMEAQRRQQQQ